MAFAFTTVLIAHHGAAVRAQVQPIQMHLYRVKTEQVFGYGLREVALPEGGTVL